MSESFFSLFLLVIYKKMAELMSHILLPALAEFGLAIYICVAPADTITTPETPVKVYTNPTISVSQGSTTHIARRDPDKNSNSKDARKSS